MQVSRLYLFLGVLFLLAGCHITVDPPLPETPKNDFKVHTIYVVPSDEEYINDHAVRIWRSVFEAQNWYQTATGGATFEILDEENVIELYDADHEKAYYQDDWWNLLLTEMREKGQFVESPGTILLIYVEGVASMNATELALGGWSCDGDCGAAILPMSILLTPTQPPTDMGTVLHELGHTFGLTHPVEAADLPLPPEQAPTLYSVMCQSDIRAGSINSDYGFLTSEKAALLKNPFLKPNVYTYQDIWNTRIINYPVLGAVPEPVINFEMISAQSVKFSSNIPDGLMYYWYFGDGSTSTDPEPTFSYNNAGLYNVILMVTTNDYMAARTNQYISIK